MKLGDANTCSAVAAFLTSSIWLHLAASIERAHRTPVDGPDARAASRPKQESTAQDARQARTLSFEKSANDLRIRNVLHAHAGKDAQPSTHAQKRMRRSRRSPELRYVELPVARYLCTLPVLPAAKTGDCTAQLNTGI